MEGYIAQNSLYKKSLGISCTCVVQKKRGRVGHWNVIYTQGMVVISRPEGYLISRREIGGPLRFLHGDNMIHLKILYVIEALLSHPDQDGIKYQLYQYLMQFFFPL